MRFVFFIFTILVTTSHCIAQNHEKIKGDTLLPGTYDTVRIELESKISFPFCSEIYKIPRECNINLPPNCCTYRTSPYKNEKTLNTGSVSCSNGSSLYWHYSSSLETAKHNFENMSGQWEKQQKNSKKTKIKCLILGKETEAYLIENVLSTGQFSYTLIAYGTHKGYNFLLQYNSFNNTDSNKDIQPFLHPIIKFK